MTLANKITVFRLLLIAGLFVLLQYYLFDQSDTLVLDGAILLLLGASVLDVVDGYVARRRGEVTATGRVIDPLVDKIMICGSFIYYTGFDVLDGIVGVWIPVVLVVREFAVHAVRVDLEGQGVAFGASAWGKIKTLLQSIAAVGCLLYGAHLDRLESGPYWRMVLLVLIGLAVASTALSGIIYAIGAVRALRRTGGRSD